MASLARHSLVWLEPEGWKEALDAAGDSCREGLACWGARDWPAIVRRCDDDAAPDQVCLGVALPPDPVSGAKRRIALRARQELVKKSLAPLNLEHAVPDMPGAWQPHLAALCEQAGAAGIGFRVYGSAAMQHLTGESYLTPSSDLDLLFLPTTSAQLAAGLALLSVHTGAVPLDGEIVFPSGHAVAWKEWLGAQRAQTGCRVLAKELHAVRLMKPQDLLDTLEDRSCIH
ncbi:malonate decarboxylase holo-[acyl-carrier-protein] synthase [Noviherbaspirillum sp. UKPF54]|uniref:malonate decarboxylase holo-[acyl-carrier-protein] synthase n=1 Tax=Noviherbaspirillum sp. UKPF54 TaxID=2601898 RepID=UPI0011B17B51|nr:malonate decarboxylase holo-[acyl-carrier-protein] synthase [Noviherbaspirillum sp. UKPF54]QDZ26671.1 malonate decarboxylase holo-[acyl-carrier-protein] synthase [Noviherbaspirillum sp. UKPF54]